MVGLTNGVFYCFINLEKVAKNNYPMFYKREIKFNFYLTQEMNGFLEKLAQEKKQLNQKLFEK